MHAKDLANIPSLKAKPRGTNKWIALCPAHPDRNPSLSLRQDGDTVLAHCFSGCTIEAITAALDLSTSDLSIDSHPGNRAPKKAVQEPEREFPRYAQVACLWDLCAPVTQDPEVKDWLKSRCIDAERVQELGLARVLLNKSDFGWARHFGGTLRVLLPVYDGRSGAFVTLRTRDIDPKSVTKEKAAGGSSKETFFCNQEARQLLRGEHSSEEVLLVEGSTDFLCLATTPLDIPLLGIHSGSWAPPMAARLKARGVCRIFVATDLDNAGDQYAQQITNDCTPLGIEIRRWDGIERHPQATDINAALLSAGSFALLESIRNAHPTATATPLEDDVNCPVLICLADVVPEKIQWLWANRIPKAKVSLLDGDPGLGKSTLTLDLAAKISAGRALPQDEAHPAANVLIVSAEDGLKDTIRPRLGAANADLKRITFLDCIGKGDNERPISFPADLPILEKAIKDRQSSLVIIDPLMAFLGSKIDAHKDQDIRRVFHKLKRIAESTGAAIVIVRHLNKSRGGPALYRGSGSIGIIGSVRSGLLVAKDKEDSNNEGWRVLAPLKNNLAPLGSGLKFRIIEAQNSAGVIEWGESTTQMADDLVSEPLQPVEQNKIDQAEAFLRKVLAGGPLEASQVEQRAAEAGISKSTLKRAKSSAGIHSDKGEKAWLWSLRSSPSKTVDPLGPLGTLPTNTTTYQESKKETKGTTVDPLDPLDNPERKETKETKETNLLFPHDPLASAQNDWKGPKRTKGIMGIATHSRDDVSDVSPALYEKALVELAKTRVVPPDEVPDSDDKAKALAIETMPPTVRQDFPTWERNHLSSLVAGYLRAGEGTVAAWRGVLVRQKGLHPSMIKNAS